MFSVQTDFNLVTFDYFGLLYVSTSSEIKCPMNSVKIIALLLFENNLPTNLEVTKKSNE